MRKLTYLLLIVNFLFYPTAFAAPHWKEHVIQYNSTITVNENASLTVTEHIKAYANDNLIKHGIVRILPLHISTPHSFSRDIQYKIMEVELDKHRIPYFTETKDNKLYVYIGNKTKNLKPNYYEFTLKYEVTNALSFTREWDELRWNVTSNDWDIPLLNVKAKVIIPNERTVKNFQATIASEQKYGLHYTVSHPAPNEIVFKTKYLSPNQALNIDLSWLEGKVARPPSIMDEIRRTIHHLIPKHWTELSTPSTIERKTP